MLDEAPSAALRGLSTPPQSQGVRLAVGQVRHRATTTFCACRSISTGGPRRVMDQWLSTKLEVSVHVPDGVSTRKCRVLLRIALLEALKREEMLDFHVTPHLRSNPDPEAKWHWRSDIQAAVDAALALPPAPAGARDCAGSSPAPCPDQRGQGDARESSLQADEAPGVSVDSSADSTAPAAQPQPEGLAAW